MLKNIGENAPPSLADLGFEEILVGNKYSQGAGTG
jgi:hypothetical protein